MGVKEITPGQLYRLDYRDSFGERHRVDFKGSKRAATAEYMRLKTKAAERQDNPKSFTQARIKTIMEEYMERRQGKGGERASRSHVDRIVARWGELTLETLVRQVHLLDVWFHRELPLERSKNNPNKPIAQKTVWNIKATFAAAIERYMLLRGLNMRNPLERIEVLKGTKVRHDWPREEQFRALLLEVETGPYKKKVRDILRWLFVAGWETGLRRGEIWSWRWEHMDLERRPNSLPWYRVQIEKQGDRPLVIEVPMSRPLWEVLMEIPGQKERGPVWPRSKWPEKHIRQCLDNAGLQHLRFHDIRKAYKTTKKAAGFGRELTKAAQGHRSDSMDSYYTNLGRSDLEQLVRDSWGEEERG